MIISHLSQPVNRSDNWDEGIPVPEISFTIGATSFVVSRNLGLWRIWGELELERIPIDDARAIGEELDGVRVEGRREGDIEARVDCSDFIPDEKDPFV